MMSKSYGGGFEDVSAPSIGLRTSSARITPLEPDQWNSEQRDLLSQFAGLAPNLHKTLARYPAALQSVLACGRHIVRGSSLEPRDRELLVLRTAFHCRCGYQWTHHVSIAQAAGLTAEEIECVKHGPSSANWSRKERALLVAADELHHDHHVSSSAWTELTALFSERQIMDVVLTVGLYTQLAMALNSFGVQLEPELAGVVAGELRPQQET